MQHFAALGGEVVDVLLHLALVLTAVAHLTLDQLLAVLAADDGGNPVAEPSGQNLDCVGGVLGAVRDRVRAFDGNGADRPCDGSALLVEILRLDLRAAWSKTSSKKASRSATAASRRARRAVAHALYACRRAFCSSKSACPRLVTLAAPSAPPAPTAVPRSVPPMPARASNVVESIRALPRLMADMQDAGKWWGG